VGLLVLFFLRGILAWHFAVLSPGSFSPAKSPAKGTKLSSEVEYLKASDRKLTDSMRKHGLCKHSHMHIKHLLNAIQPPISPLMG